MKLSSNPGHLEPATLGAYEITQMAGANEGEVTNYLYHCDRLILSDSREDVQRISRMVDQLSGRVLLVGLGLGTAIGLASENPEVTGIVVVEKDVDLVSLAHWVPPPPKLEYIIPCDPGVFLRHPLLERFDTALFGYWPENGESAFFEKVMPLLNDARGTVATPPLCWNEEEMRARLYRDALTAMVFGLGRGRTRSPRPASEFDPGKTLSYLNATQRDNMYLSWMIPMFERIEVLGLDREEAIEFAEAYTNTLGKEDWNA